MLREGNCVNPLFGFLIPDFNEIFNLKGFNANFFKGLIGIYTNSHIKGDFFLNLIEKCGFEDFFA